MTDESSSIPHPLSLIPHPSSFGRGHERVGKAAKIETCLGGRGFGATLPCYPLHGCGTAGRIDRQPLGNDRADDRALDARSAVFARVRGAGVCPRGFVVAAKNGRAP